MGIEDEPAQIRLLKNLFEAGRIGALRQPEASGFGVKGVAKDVTSDQDLRALSFG